MKKVELRDFTLVCNNEGELFVETDSPAKASPFIYEANTGNLWFNDTPFYGKYFILNDNGL